MRNFYKKGQSDVRPWGTWEVLDVGDGFCVKIITVNPHQKLSLQYHVNRHEMWFIVQGEAVVLVDGVSEVKCYGNMVNIPATILHRIANETEEVLKFVEIQYGECLSEDDIIRVEDAYGRV